MTLMMSNAFFTFRRQLLFRPLGTSHRTIAFGIEDQSIATLKGAIEVTCAMVGHPIAETDPELGTNLMFFFIRDWDELLAVPDLDRIMPNLSDLVGRLQAAESQQYRSFRFDEQARLRPVLYLCAWTKNCPKCRPMPCS